MRYLNYIINDIKSYTQILKILYKDKYNLIKYMMVSVISYLYVLGALYMLVSLFNFDKLFSYIFVYISVYIIEYVLTLIFVFNKKHSIKKFLKFAVYIMFFLVISSLIYKWLLSVHLNYLIAAIFVALILMPMRYF